MKSFFLLSLFASTFVSATLVAQDSSDAAPVKSIIDVTSNHDRFLELIPNWNFKTYRSLRCPLPYDEWTDKNGWQVILLEKNKIPMLCLETPAGAITDIIIDETRQLAVVSLHVDRATPVIYIVSIKQNQVWAANIKTLEDAINKLLPEDEEISTLSPFCLVGLRQKDNVIEGLTRYRSALNPKDRNLSMLVRFHIDLDAELPAEGAPWPIIDVKIEDSEQIRDWRHDIRDFEPSFMPPEKIDVPAPAPTDTPAPESASS